MRYMLHSPEELPKTDAALAKEQEDLLAAYVRGAGAALRQSARALSSVRLLAYASEGGVSTKVGSAQRSVFWSVPTL